MKMRQNCLNSVADIAEQPKRAYWIEKITSFNMMSVTNKISERIAAEFRPEQLH
jgi:hypothetical protein